MAILEPGEAAFAYKAKILGYQAGADFLALQASAPAKLASLVGGLSAEELARRPAPDKWSIQELVAHLADDELVGGYRIRMILSTWDTNSGVRSGCMGAHWKVREDRRKLVAGNVQSS